MPVGCLGFAMDGKLVKVCYLYLFIQPLRWISVLLFYSRLCLSEQCVSKICYLLSMTNHSCMSLFPVCSTIYVSRRLAVEKNTNVFYINCPVARLDD